MDRLVEGIAILVLSALLLLLSNTDRLTALF
jgi:hypothetical protein